MGYYTIGNYKIFYSADRFAEIDEPYLAKLEPIERVGLNMLGMDLKPSKARLELDRLHITTLQTEFKRLTRKEFENKWVNLYFKWEEASNNSWEIIYDYFHIFKNGKIKDSRDFVEKITDSYSGLSSIYPQGKVVELIFNINRLNDNTWTKLFGKRIELIKELNLKTVTSIEGSLTNLQIDTPSETLYLSDTIRFMDKSKYND
jgi:hypothetical protein